MNVNLVERLRCPKTGRPLSLEGEQGSFNEIETGWLISEDGQHRYPIKRGIPRFVPESNYADNFGMQWSIFSKTQLDSYSGHPISANRFWGATGWDPNELLDKWVLDVGCGSGRFAEIALLAGARVVALDYSNAVDACYSNLRHHKHLYVVQGDVYSLPFAPRSFSYVYSLGVLQHTPDVANAFLSLPPMLCGNGQLCADFYWNRFRTLLHPKYLLRPFTTKISQVTLFSWLQSIVPILLRLSQYLGRIPVVGRLLKRIVPIADYTGIYPLSPRQLEEWALLDTFDMLAPTYDNPQSMETVREWFQRAGFKDVTVFHCGHLVGRGTAK